MAMEQATKIPANAVVGRNVCKWDNYRITGGYTANKGDNYRHSVTPRPSATPKRSSLTQPSTFIPNMESMSVYYD